MPQKGLAAIPGTAFVLHHCDLAPLQFCIATILHLRDYITAILHHCDSASLQFCITATLHHCDLAPLQFCIAAILHLCDYVTAILHHCDSASLQFYITATLHYCNSLTLPFENTVILHHCDSKILWLRFQWAVPKIEIPIFWNRPEFSFLDWAVCSGVFSLRVLTSYPPSFNQ